jgi:ribulose 1,5-bisphosphate synthetase/thiazole synthase
MQKQTGAQVEGVERYDRELRIAGEYDVVVAGGGLAGVSAATAAALAGAKTAIIEQQSFAGGVATATMEGTMCRHFHSRTGELVVGGRALELVECLVRMGATTKNWPSHNFHITFDIEPAKLAMDEMLEDAGVDIYYGTTVTDVLMENRTVRGPVVSNRSGNQAMRAGCVIDATGDADVAHYANAPLRKGRSGNSFMFRLANVDMDRLVAFFRDNPEEYGIGRSVDDMLGFYDDGYFILEHYGDKLRKTVGEAIERGEYAREWGPFHDMHAFKMSGVRALKTLNVNTGMIRIEAPDGKTLSDILRQGRKMAFHVASFLKGHLPGCEHSSIVHTSTMLGLRHTRWLDGEFTLTEELYGQPFDDAVGWGVALRKWCSDQDIFDVPLRCMLPKDVEGLIVGSGRSTSSTPAEMLRVESVTMIVGQGAGVAAAVSVRDGVPVREVDTVRVRKALQEQGCTNPEA